MTREKRLNILLTDLCVKLGFCLPASEQKNLINNTPITPKEFTDAVFWAEKLNPEHADSHLYRQVKAMVLDAFEVIDLASDS